MRKLALQFAAAIALTLGAIVALAAPSRASDITVSAAFARASATSSAKTGVAYFTITNTGSAPDRLITVASAAAGMVMLHESAVTDGVATMRHIETLAIAPGESAVLAPNGLHAMLMDLKAPLKKGSTIAMTLAFEKAGEVVVQIPVGGVAQDGPLGQ